MCEEGSIGREERENEKKKEDERRSNSSFQTLALRPAFVPPGWMDEQVSSRITYGDICLCMSYELMK
jgi:hypothetical protein